MMKVCPLCGGKNIKQIKISGPGGKGKGHGIICNNIKCPTNIIKRFF